MKLPSARKILGRLCLYLAIALVFFGPLRTITVVFHRDGNKTAACPLG